MASHKAGILRRGRPAICAPQRDEALHVIESEAAKLDARLEKVGVDWWWTSTPRGSIEIASKHADFAALEARLALLGRHQRDNAATAAAALHALQHVRPDIAPTREGIKHGLEHVDWPGRLQVLREHPLIVLDGAHNGASADALRRALGDVFTYERMHLVLGLTIGKDARGVLDSLVPAANFVYLTQSQHERSSPPSELAVLVRQRTDAPVELRSSVAAAIDQALDNAGKEDLVLVTGSLFVVGEALVWWNARRSSR
ncbi:MAG: hypothetical protein JOZ81_31595 [Chloroflexi bacterium]|nr:hypothetical protein [Chloroflexota bacterium]